VRSRGRTLEVLLSDHEVDETRNWNLVEALVVAVALDLGSPALRAVEWFSRR
jgi:hypothetical protein